MAHRRCILSWILGSMVAQVYGLDYTGALCRQMQIKNAEQFRRAVPLMHIYEAPSCTKRNNAWQELAGLVLGYTPCVYADDMSHVVSALQHDYNLLMALSYADLRVARISISENGDADAYTSLVVYGPQWRYRARLLVIHPFVDLVRLSSHDLRTKARIYLLGTCFGRSEEEIEHAAQYVEFMQQRKAGSRVYQQSSYGFEQFKVYSWAHYGVHRFTHARSLCIQSYTNAPSVAAVKDSIQRTCPARNARAMVDLPMNTFIDTCVDPTRERFAVEKETILKHIESITPAQERDGKLL